MRETSNANTPSRRAQTHRKENCVLDGERERERTILERERGGKNKDGM